MDITVPPQVSAELTQILSNLVLGDNEIRANAEKIVNERLSQTPELYILALAQFASTAADEQMRSFSLILLRRLLFRALPSASSGSRLTLYDHLSEQTRLSLERVLLNSLLNEPVTSVKHKAADTIADVANASFERGRPWPALQEAVFRAVGGDVASRDSAFRVMERCSVLSGDIPEEIITRGLRDTSVEVRLSAVKAATSFLSINHSVNILGIALGTLPIAPPSHLTRFLNALTTLATTQPTLFAPHLKGLLSFLPGLLLNTKEYDSGPTPTVARPFPNAPHHQNHGHGHGHGQAFQFPPPALLSPAAGRRTPNTGEEEAEEEREEARKAALELMVALSEARPSMVRRVDGWAAAIVRACLEGMGELKDDAEELQEWLDADPADDPTDATYPHVYEQALDRLSCALNGKPVLQVAFQYIPAMLASHDWRLRHGGLMAIAALGEGGAKVMQNELGKVVELVTTTFHDPHPRVRYAACQCIGQLCTDLEEIIQENYHAQVFSVLIPTLSATEPRVHAHAAAALINFCEGVAHDTLVPYLDAIVERLLNMLNPGSNAGGEGARYVQEQAITTLAMVADASETTFAKHYATIMPLLLNVLRNANAVDHKKLRWKAMECAGLIAIAVGRDVFRPDSNELIELLMRIQNSPRDQSDTMLNHYLIATWAKICQALGPEFEPYLPIVMPPLLQAASAKADVSVWGDDDEHKMSEKDGWETMSLDGQQVGIKTSVIEEKCQAFETLVIYCSTLGAKFAPYLSQSLELVLPSLRFVFHEGVREACAMVIPMLLVCGKQSNTLTPQMLNAVFQQLTTVIESETDASFLASLYKCFADSLKVISGPSALSPELRAGILSATRNQLQVLAERRKARAARPAQERLEEREDLALLEELEDFALEDMSGMLKYFEEAQGLLVAVGSVKALGVRGEDWDEDDAGE
ncbi:ARM repeat-containing protein [Rickenella mellea]|uniref:ARM repeat-containing protein n=1 Tax=Rickenella mellea TaxID=50990 RepID=A0A4Y7PLE4_9AGAM|nr:ARM repeat-containing protein [Rickenella mellea]